METLKDSGVGPKDRHAEGLYRKYGLRHTATLSEIKPVAVRLLSHIDTAVEGAELLLGRKITDHEATELISAVMIGVGSGPETGEQKFQNLLRFR